MPSVHEWETFPFEGDLRVLPLGPPVAEEAPRRGAGGVDCHVCTAPDDDFLWTDERWRLSPLPEPSGLLIGSFAAIWDDILPPVPEDLWREDLRTVAEAMAAGGGAAHVV